MAMTRTRAATIRAAPRRKLPRAERETQMLDIAAQAFGTHGFHAASMDEIARACGVTKPMLYAYFTSKEGLYLATVERAGRYLVGAIEALLAEPEPLARLQKGAELLLRFIERDRHGWSVLFAEGLGDQPVARRVADYRGRIAQAAAVTLAEARGSAVPDAAAIGAALPHAVGMLGAGEALARWWLTQPAMSFETVRAATDDIVAAVLESYRRRRPLPRAARTPGRPA